MSDQFAFHLPFETAIEMDGWDTPTEEALIESLPTGDGFDEASVGQWLNSIVSGIASGVPAGLAVGGPWGGLFGGLGGAALGALQTALGDQSPAPPASGPPPPPPTGSPTPQSPPSRASADHTAPWWQAAGIQPGLVDGLVPPSIGPPAPQPPGRASGDQTTALLQQLAALLPTLITALSRSGGSRESQREDIPGPALASDVLPISDSRLAAHVMGEMGQTRESVTTPPTSPETVSPNTAASKVEP